MPSQIIKMNLTFYSIFHVPYVLKIKIELMKDLNDRNTNEHHYLWNGYSPVLWQWKFTQQGQVKWLTLEVFMDMEAPLSL